MKKIVIFGFPHTGTTIMKSIIGHIPDVYEIINEQLSIEEDDVRIAESTNKKFILCKFPYWTNKFMEDRFKEYYKIFIVRNPVYVYTSLNKRFSVMQYDDQGYKIMNNQVPLWKYSDTVRLFNWFKVNSPLERMMTIKYEDFFDNNFQNIKNILDNIGLTYTDEIFDNSKYKNYSVNGVQIPEEKPSNFKHSEYRTWQINQPFVNNNIPGSVFLLQEQIEHFKSCPHIGKIYPLVRKVYIDEGDISK